MKETAIVTKEETPLASVPTGLDLISQEDLILPTIRLHQPISEGEGEVGKFINTLTGEVFSAKRLQLVAYWPGRSLWREGEDEPVCSSSDAELPDERVKDPASESCLTCPHAERTAGRQAACGKVYRFVAVDIETGMLCAMKLQKTSAYAGRRLLSFAWQHKAPVYRVQFTLSSSKATKSKGHYYVAQVGGLEIVDLASAVSAAAELAG